MPFDYSNLIKKHSENSPNSWEKYYDNSLSLPANFENLLRRSVFLPNDFYKIITAYAFIPSVLARVVPYLFFWGRSGSGKSTIGKLIAQLHGIRINSSSDSFAGIRNSLNQRRYTWVKIPTDDPAFPDGVNKKVEANTIMVWDDIDPKVLASTPDIYRLLKFGYDKSCDKIEISSEVAGENLVFRCFCPKVFSSISALHTDEQFTELRRRLIVIPTKRVEDLPESRQAELAIANGDWQTKLLDVDAIDWTGFSELFKEFWSLDLAELYLTYKQLLSTYSTGLTSLERVVSLDLLATGIATGIWSDESTAIADIKSYWQWFKQEITTNEAPLVQLIKDFVSQEAANARNGGLELVIYNYALKQHLRAWIDAGYLLETPNNKTVKDTLNELGLRLISKGRWIKS